MNAGFRDLAAGAFVAGLAKLNEAPEWHDDNVDLDGPFRLSFPATRGWGEDLLVASLLKRYAVKSGAPAKVFSNWQVCSILKHDSVYDAQLCKDNTVGRSPLAILRQALLGDLLAKPFIPISRPDTHPTSPTARRSRVGIAWASVSNNRLVSEKSLPLEDLLPLLCDIDADFISLQRQLNIADPTGLLSNFGVSVLADEVLNTTTVQSLDSLVEAIISLDLIVTVSTTVTHIAAAMGIRVDLLAAERRGQQWFWQVQANHQKCMYPTVRIHLGDGRGKMWWTKSLESLRASLLNK